MTVGISTIEDSPEFIRCLGVKKFQVDFVIRFNCAIKSSCIFNSTHVGLGLAPVSCKLTHVS